MDRNELLDEAYKHLKWALFSKGKLGINISIKRKVRYLKELYGISSEDLLHDIFENFVAKKHYEKFNPAKGKLSTFMTHYANLSLLNIIKKHNRLISNNKKVSLPEDYEDTFDQKRRYSLSYLEKIDFSDGLIERKTPEDLYLAKELYEEMEEFFGKDDFEVLQEVRTRSEEARHKGIEYETYRKRLHRKKLDFLRRLDNGD
ncbi:MAG: hypothetical protein KKI12_06955 [Proteobacteria bacterium]|nr:hypothetical protein [Pseudomonadota bacterium]